jgi:hypothetical protein
MVETENVIVVICSIHQLHTTQGSNHNLENMHVPCNRERKIYIAKVCEVNFSLCIYGVLQKQANFTSKARSMVMYICVRTIYLLIFCLFTWLTHIPTNRPVENANEPKYQMKINIVV